MNTQPRPEDILKQGTVERYAPIDDKVTPLRPPSAYKIEAVNAAQIEAPRPSEYLIKGIIEPAQTSIWFGPPGNGKTFLLLHLAYAIARGESVFGRRVRQADTLYMALEGRGGIDKRIYAMTKSMGASKHFWRSAHPLELLKVDRDGARINTEHVEALVAFIREKAIKMVVIDTLNLTLGGADENSNSDMGMLIKAAGEIAQSTGAHMATVAHSAKAGIDGGPRGGGAQKGNADLVVSVSGEETFTASCFAPAGKIKDGAAFKLHFQLKVEDLLTDDDGDVMTSCTIEEAEAPEADTTKRLTPSQAGWLADLEQMFQETGADAPVRREPVSGLTCLTLTRDQVREGFKRKGRLGDVRADGGTEPKYRQQLSTALIALKDRGKINMTDKLVWLIN
jgi:hypothetical protein